MATLPTHPECAVRVLAVGSPHGDDGVGWEAARLLEAEGVAAEVIVLAQPLELLEHLGGETPLVVVDACRSGAAAGTIHRLTWPAAALHAGAGPSTHGVGVAESLALAEALGRPLPLVVLIGIEAQACAPGDELSPAVQAALPELCRQVRVAIEQLRRGHPESSRA